MSSSGCQAERASLPFLCLFGLFKPSRNWMMPSHIGGRGDLLYSDNRFNTDTAGNNV